MKKTAKIFTALSVIFLFNTVHADVTYSWKAPYAGAVSFTVHNRGTEPVAINQINFSTAAMIVSPYGALNTSTVNISANETNGFEVYSLNYSAGDKPQPYMLAPGADADFTGMIGSVTGPFSVGMTVKDVKINGLAINDDAACKDSACNDPTPGYRVTGYYTDWDQYARKYNATDIPVTHANTINYAFIDADKQGNVILLDTNSDYKQLTTIGNLQRSYPYLQTFLSFGGWTKSANYSDLFTNPDARANFIKNAIAAMRETGFNGIDLDWEYPVSGTRIVSGSSEIHVAGKPEDAANLAAFLTELRVALNVAEKQDGKKYYISIAAPAGSDKINAIKAADPTAWGRVAKAIDYLNLMSYDFHGAFDYKEGSPYSIADYQAAIKIDPRDPTNADPLLKTYDVTTAVELYKSVGFTSKQIILGIPAYGRMENLATEPTTANQYGLYQPLAAGTPAGEYDDWQSGNTGIFDYKCIVDQTKCGGAGSSLLAGIKTLDAAARVDLTTNAMMAFAYIPTKKQFISYDDAQSVKAKTQWAKQQGLGGVMFWTFSGDLPVTESASLIATAKTELQ